MTFLPSNALQIPLEENLSFSGNWDTFLEQITKVYRDIARKVNEKERAYYPLEQEILNDQKFFAVDNPQQFRSVFRKVFNFGTIAKGAPLNIPHNIIGLMSFTKIYGVISTDLPDDRPLPYADAFLATNQTSILRNGADLIIQNGATAPNILSGYLIVEYLKN